MKKLFIIALALALMVAFTVPAMAKTKVSFSGDYRVQWRYWNNYTLADDSDDEDKLSYIRHRWRMNFKLMPTDRLDMNMRFTYKDHVWGTGSRSYYNPSANQPMYSDAAYVELDRLYMGINTGMGRFELGKQPTGASGLVSMGWSGSSFAPSEIGDALTVSNGTMDWILPMGSMWFYLSWEKKAEMEGFDGVQDGDNDGFTAIVGGKLGSMGQWSLLGHYLRNATLAANGFASFGLPAGYYDKQTYFFLQPALMLNFGAFTIASELGYLTGTIESMDTDIAEDIDITGLRFFIAATFNYGAGTVGLQYSYTSGDDPDTDEYEAYTGTGADFIPMFVAYDAFGYFADSANHHFVGAWVDHSVSEDLMLHAAFGWFKVIEVPDEVDDAGGIEFDFGVSYNVMSNLNNTLMFGYFMPGDYFKGGYDIDLGNAYAIQNTLTLKF